MSCDFVGETTARFEQERQRRSIQCLGKNCLFTVAMFRFEKINTKLRLVNTDQDRGDGVGPAGTAAAGPMLEAKLMNLIKGQLQKF